MFWVGSDTMGTVCVEPWNHFAPLSPGVINKGCQDDSGQPDEQASTTTYESDLTEDEKDQENKQHGKYQNRAPKVIHHSPAAANVNSMCNQSVSHVVH